MAKPAASKAENFKRYRISVPVEDMEVWKWIEMQSNLSFSMRTLIKAAIKDNGMKDVTCGIQEMKIILGLTKIAEAYQVGTGNVPAEAVIDQAMPAQAPRPMGPVQMPAAVQQPLQAAPEPMQAPPPAAERPTVAQTPPAAQTQPVQAPPVPNGYPVPPSEGEQGFIDPGDILDN